MQTEVVNRQFEESEIVTEKLYSSCEDGVNTMGSIVNDPTCWGNYPVAKDWITSLTVCTSRRINYQRKKAYMTDMYDQWNQKNQKIDILVVQLMILLIIWEECNEGMFQTSPFYCVKYYKSKIFISPYTNKNGKEVKCYGENRYN